MTTYDLDDRLMMTPIDHEAPRRVVRLRELGVGDNPDNEFDDFARRLAEVTGAPYAMVNFIDETRQFFAGMYTPATPSSPAASGPSPAPDAGREAPGDYGYCPHVVVRRKALVLEDVCDYPRFAGNPIVDDMGIRSYMGAPLIDRTGTTLGTVCVGDVEPHPWGRPGLVVIKSMAAEVIERIHQREAWNG
ncbi:MAG: GAF domain-containing protein [Stackebrandtia sp.]